ncbi:hypothetical protein BJ878DRAFT_512502 [Calycina marina]|uniref:pH-response regulator protein palC n=1 Tax=Calycina marina TaxID=1763456 RepID=A0A9P7Z0J7_9HELO|nr:hypothetical protein BJ878DRAFT_512502 [Calycina marina]
MPFPFTLPTTSRFLFTGYFDSSSHPSLPLSASTYRGVVQDALKRHKQLPLSEQPPNLSALLQSLNNYIPYLLAIDSGLGGQSAIGEEIDVVLKSTPVLRWRPTLSDGIIPGREIPYVKIESLEYEIYFTLSTLAYVYTLLSRAYLHPLYSSATASPTPEQRTTAIAAATKNLLLAASVHDYLARRADQLSSEPPSVDITKYTFRALSSLALAEATLLAVLKDDPYPAAVAQDRNANDKDWMIRAPQIAKVRAHLFARLCLEGAQHAANAASLLNSTAAKGQGKIHQDLIKYADDLRRTSRSKAFRMLGIDAELGNQTGVGIAWLQGGLHELGFAPKEVAKKGLSLGRFKKGWSEKREDKKVENGGHWGSDAGKLEEARVLEMLEKKWTKENDTVNTQTVPAYGTLTGTMPSGREIHALKPYAVPGLDSSALEAMRAPPDHADDEAGDSSDGETDRQSPCRSIPWDKGRLF